MNKLFRAIASAVLILAVSACGSPKGDIKLYGPGTDSGTFDYFSEAINGKEKAHRSDYTSSEDDNILVRGVAADKYALGYFGFAYYVENKDKLKLVAVDSGSGCVLPSQSNIESGSYKPLSRPLFIYVNQSSLKKPQVYVFVKYYLEHAARLSKEVGYVPFSNEIYEGEMKKIYPGEVAGSPSGVIEADGSSTVGPITEAVAEEFRGVHSGVQVNVGVSGTGGGFKRFVKGETDISNASRPIKKAEADAAKAAGVSYIELRVALDGIAVVVNPANDFVSCLTTEELKKIWGPGSAVKRWSEIREEFAGK